MLASKHIASKMMRIVTNDSKRQQRQTIELCGFLQSRANASKQEQTVGLILTW